MKNRILIASFLALICGLINVSGQIQTAETPKPSAARKHIAGGVLNGKATTLVKPSYPKEAHAAGVGGAVNVQVTIDENGDVVSAKAVSGDSLLHEECERAARASKFAPTILEGQPIMITGVVIYNFVPAMTMTQVGYELALAEHSKVIQKYQINSINGTLPPKWEKEKELLRKLDFLLVEKTALDKTPEKPATADGSAGKLAPTEVFRGNGTNTTAKDEAAGYSGAPPRMGIATRIGSFSYDSKHSLNNDSLALINELQSALKTRLSVRENIIWSFKLGELLGKMKAELESVEKTRSNISEISQLSADSPANIPSTITEKIKELVEFFNQTMTNAERVEKMSPLIENLRNFRSY